MDAEILERLDRSARWIVEGVDEAEIFSPRELAAFGRTFDGGSKEDARDRALCGLAIMAEATDGDGSMNIPPVLRWAIGEVLKAYPTKNGNTPLFFSEATGKCISEEEADAMVRRRCDEAGIRSWMRGLETFRATGHALAFFATQELPRNWNGPFEWGIEEAMRRTEEKLQRAARILFGFEDVPETDGERWQ